MLEHIGSNSMNLAKILVGPSQDLGVIVMFNCAALSAFRQNEVAKPAVAVKRFHLGAGAVMAVANPCRRLFTVPHQE